ncbi:unnamed protein product [Candida verbasci]|uniref:Bul1 N-terminal domain-containing protein n=1 Tax=Candida verbasci TaxID=1227364 RepID=A0A9W4XH41_9ASCO|nr:unnamed protein product [Candida verbasci]
MDDRNKFRLKLSSLSMRGSRNDSQDNNNNEDDEANLLVNILPSYHMYRSTITKQLTPSVEDLRTDPPSYELTPLQTPDLNSTLSTQTSLHDYFMSQPTSPALEPQNIDEQLSGNDQFEQEQENDDTILENAHKLKRLTSSNKDISKLLEIKINITKNIGKVGETPKILNPLTLELKQGDYVYGFVLITNRISHEIPFDMFSVQLEGCLTFGNVNNNNTLIVEQPTKFSRFLTMFDFNASWNDAFLDRLVTDNNNPYRDMSKDQEQFMDPQDHTYYQLNSRKVFEPGRTYKKFFTFKLPEKLLDSDCEHSLIRHLQIPPTLGICKNEIINTLRHKWKDSKDSSIEGEEILKNKYKYASLTNDFSFLDTSISYCISARVIGRASEYKELLGGTNNQNIDIDHDEYVVANEDYKYLRVIPVSPQILQLNRSMIHQEARLLYGNFIEKIKEKIEFGKELIEKNQHIQPISSQSSLRPISSSSSLSSLHNINTLEPSLSVLELAKMQQSYYSKSSYRQRFNSTESKDVYEVFLPYKKKSMFGSSKIIGLTAFSTPKVEYKANYIPLPQFQNKIKNIDQLKKENILKVPINLTFIFGEEKYNSPSSLPDFKSVSVDLIALTIKSKKHSIPVAIHPEMLFDNKSKAASSTHQNNLNLTHDNFDYITIKRFQKYAAELSKILKQVDPELLDLDKDFVKDIKCLASLSTNFVHMRVKHVHLESSTSLKKHDTITSIPWEKNVLENNDDDAVRYDKKLILLIDLNSAMLKPVNSTDFCLVPEFQSCLLARVYYLKIDFKLSNLEKISLRVPVVLQKT